jgi:hypothetical protein
MLERAPHALRDGDRTTSLAGYVTISRPVLTNPPEGTHPTVADGGFVTGRFVCGRQPL